QYRSKQHKKTPRESIQFVFGCESSGPFISWSLSHNSRFSLAQESRIESRIASRGNQTLGGCQASENIALARDDGLAMLRCVSITPAHNIVRQCNASCGKFFLALLEALEHVVCPHWHTAALFYKFFAAS